MTVLLDTHVWLWMLADPDRLGALRPLIEDESNALLLSAASSWEIAIKHASGRLPLPEPPTIFVPSRIRATGAGRPVHNSNCSTACLTKWSRPETVRQPARRASRSRRVSRGLYTAS